MKNKKYRWISSAKAKRRKIKKLIISRRPLHKKILLHPSSLFILLCIGVFLIGVTIKISAVVYTVNAVVPGSAPTKAATILQPISQIHFTSGPINVTGGCPNNSYVKLYRNDIFSGVAICKNNAYQIITDLSLGSNILVARVYNFQNLEGPVSTQTIVYFDQQAVAPRASTTTLQLLAIEGTVPNPNVIKQLSNYPVIIGIAPPLSHVVVTAHSNPITCETDADTQGNWACQFSREIPFGNHIMEVRAITPVGDIVTLPDFQVIIMPVVDASKQQVGLVLLSPIISSDFQYKAYNANQPISWNIIFVGGTPPYAVHVEWGDSQESNYVRQDQSSFAITHTYFTEQHTDFIVKVEATDADGFTAFIQLAAVVGQGSDSANDDSNSILTYLKNSNLLQFLWPSYIVVVLMAVSFYLGERREYQDIFRRRRLRRRTS
jgi:hypothetical protein